MLSSLKLNCKKNFELMHLLLFYLTKFPTSIILIDLRFIVCEISFDKKEIKKEEDFRHLLESFNNHRF